MSKECKKARNVVVSTIMILATLIMLLSSCGTFHWVEPMPPNAANNHRFNNSICK